MTICIIVQSDMWLIEGQQVSCQTNARKIKFLNVSDRNTGFAE